MVGAVTGPRVRLGRDVRVLSEDELGLEMEGALRLAPGRYIEVASSSVGMGDARRAFVWSWRLVRMGHRGGIYRGYCRWE